ncbi:MAG: amino acid adenylation domain-containing protein [Gammaproteobacteria bacterium]
MSLLRQRATLAPEACAYVFLADGECQEQRLCYGELDTLARVIAARLQGLDGTGERALLLYPPGLDYIAAFFGCLYAGVVAVPAYPPSRHHLHRLRAIVHDAAPAMVLTTAEWRAKLLDSYEESWGRDGLEWLATDTPVGDGTAPWVRPAVGPDSLAFLQYTSGSTGNPKGVMVSHGNLMANQRAIQEAFRHTEETIVVGWLPLYHDMGLIGNLLQPLYLGATAILMPPLAFLEQPIRWLRAISKYRAATSGGPNFAYELCTRKVAAEQKRELDLSSWTLAFNGSEPVRAATMERFSAAFAECGFRRQAFFPCYGLAEATLFVTGRRLAVKSDVGCAARTGQGETDPPGANHPASSVSCGRTFADHEIRIVDPKTGVPRPDGREGEIWIAGPSVAQGYWNRPEESEGTFRARLETGDLRLEVEDQSPLSGLRPETSFLRTDDLGILHRGDLFVTGRIKDLIILRGRNYYPHDLEQALEEGVAELRPGCSAAFSVEQAGEEALVVVAELRRDALRERDTQEILTAVRQALAEVCDAPVGELALVPPGSVPKTSSGKVRRQACKEAYLAGQLKILARSSDTGAPLPAPNSSEDSAAHLLRDALRALTKDQRAPLITRFLLSKLAQLLRVPEASLAPGTAIRTLGLDSLRAVELKHAVDALLGAEAPVSLFLGDRTLAELAQALAELRLEVADRGPEPHGDQTLLASSLQPPLSSLSHPQQAIWTVHQLEPRSIAYNLHLALRLHGHLDPAVLHRAFDLLLERHDQLRTRYRAEREAVQKTPMSQADWPAYFSVVDAAGWSESRLQADLTRRVCEPFDLAGGPVLRVTCYCQEERHHILLFCAHHIAVDLWSCLILLGELKSIVAGLMSGQVPSVPALSAGYRDFVAWQQSYLQSRASEGAWDYWRARLSGTLPILALATDLPRPPVPVYRGASHALHLDRDLTEKVKELGRQCGATLFMTLLTAYKVLLHRYTHQNDIIVGTPGNGRPQARFANLVGNFVNPIALRSYPKPELTFTTYLEQVRDAVLGALPHADYPFSMLVERLQPERVAGRWPIYQTWLVLQQGRSGVDDGLAHLLLGEESDGQTWGNWTITPQPVHEHVENFDLRLMAAEDERGLLLSFRYRRDLFESQTIARLAGHFQVLLEGIVARPESHLCELPLLTEAERRQQLIEWNATEAAYPKDRCLHELFEAQAGRTPARVAVACEGEQLTYAELNARANQLAHHLRGQGVRPEIVVALCVERSLDMIIGILGILKAGAAYVPIGPSDPQERIAYLLSDSEAPVVLTHEGLLHRLPPHQAKVVCLDRDREIIAEEPHANLPNPATPTHLAYVIYTSGSTGKPKGVAVTHGNAVHSTWARFSAYQHPVEGFLLLSAFAFDSSVAGIFWTLCQGGRLCLPPEGGEKEPRTLDELLSDGQVTHLLCLPSLYGLLLESVPQAQLRGLEAVIVAGEACPRALVTRHHLRLPHAPLFNEYGPTEATVWSSVYRAQPADGDKPVPIGRPIANVQIYRLDGHLNPVPAAVAGELCIGGAGLARGYLRRPELTAERFIPNPFGDPGSRLYRTGDLARYRPDGNIEFLGRIDHQVKVRGFRIELGEIEAKLRQHPHVKEAVVLAREDRPGDRHLVAYLAPQRGQEGGGESPLTAEHLRDFLKDTLPDFMVPSAFLLLEALPFLPNGKVDRKALPAPETGTSTRDGKAMEPRHAVDQALVEIWTEVLGAKSIGIHDNFFDLGGHSLSAIQVMVRLQDRFNVELPVASLFEAPTIAELAMLVTQQQADGQGSQGLDSLLDEIEQLSDEEAHLLLDGPQA